jgi:hypothetical protein
MYACLTVLFKYTDTQSHQRGHGDQSAAELQPNSHHGNLRETQTFSLLVVERRMHGIFTVNSVASVVSLLNSDFCFLLVPLRPEINGKRDPEFFQRR